MILQGSAFPDAHTSYPCFRKAILPGKIEITFLCRRDGEAPKRQAIIDRVSQSGRIAKLLRRHAEITDSGDDFRREEDSSAATACVRSRMIDETAIRARYAAIKGQLDERDRRLFVAAEKIAAGYGGTAAVSRATGVADSTIIRGAKDLLTAPAAPDRVRRKGAGQPALSQSDPAVLEDLRRLVEPATMGDPIRPLLWVSKSREKLAAALRTLKHSVCANTVGKMLISPGYSRQVNRKTKEGSHHPDRDGQFQHINRQVMALQAAGQPVISVDTKKKELIGECKNGGIDYRAAGCPDAVNMHDFADKILGKVAPYGFYDVATNMGWVSLGIDHDTAEFAVNAVRRWHQVVGVRSLPRGNPAVDHRRWRRLEWITRAAMETGIAEAG